MNEFDQILKKSLQEKAPDGFTDNIMDKLVAEEQEQKIVANVPILGKGFMTILFSVLVLGIIYLVNSEGSIEFAPSSKMLIFSIGAICLFLIADYIFRSRKMVQI